jgi:hypothetical protein
MGSIRDIQALNLESIIRGNKSCMKSLKGFIDYLAHACWDVTCKFGILSIKTSDGSESMPAPSVPPRLPQNSKDILTEAIDSIRLHVLFDMSSARKILIMLGKELSKFDKNNQGTLTNYNAKRYKRSYYGAFKSNLNPQPLITVAGKIPISDLNMARGWDVALDNDKIGKMINSCIFLDNARLVRTIMNPFEWDVDDKRERMEDLNLLAMEVWDGSRGHPRDADNDGTVQIVDEAKTIKGVKTYMKWRDPTRWIEKPERFMFYVRGLRGNGQDFQFSKNPGGDNVACAAGGGDAMEEDAGDVGDAMGTFVPENEGDDAQAMEEEEEGPGIADISNTVYEFVLYQEMIELLSDVMGDVFVEKYISVDSVATRVQEILRNLQKKRSDSGTVNIEEITGSGLFWTPQEHQVVVADTENAPGNITINCVQHVCEALVKVHLAWRDETRWKDYLKNNKGCAWLCGLSDERGPIWDEKKMGLRAPLVVHRMAFLLLESLIDDISSTMDDMHLDVAAARLPHCIIPEDKGMVRERIWGYKGDLPEIDTDEKEYFVGTKDSYDALDNDSKFYVKTFVDSIVLSLEKVDNFMSAAIRVRQKLAAIFASRGPDYDETSHSKDQGLSDSSVSPTKPQFSFKGHQTLPKIMRQRNPRVVSVPIETAYEYLFVHADQILFNVSYHTERLDAPLYQIVYRGKFRGEYNLPDRIHCQHPHFWRAEKFQTLSSKCIWYIDTMRELIRRMGCVEYAKEAIKNNTYFRIREFTVNYEQRIWEAKKKEEKKTAAKISEEAEKEQREVKEQVVAALKIQKEKIQKLMENAESLQKCQGELDGMIRDLETENSRPVDDLKRELDKYEKTAHREETHVTGYKAEFFRELGALQSRVRSQVDEFGLHRAHLNALQQLQATFQVQWDAITKLVKSILHKVKKYRKKWQKYQKSKSEDERGGNGGKTKKPRMTSRVHSAPAGDNVIISMMDALSIREARVSFIA